MKRNIEGTSVLHQVLLTYVRPARSIELELREVGNAEAGDNVISNRLGH